MHIQKYRRNEFVPLIINLIQLYHPKTYVEIGVAEGYTFNKIIANCPEIETAVAVDINPMPNVPVDNYKVKDVCLYEMPSQEFAKTWKDPIDMLFIDGDHNKETVEHDFFEIGKFVRTGTGLILMHDTHPVTEELLQPRFCHNAWEFADNLFEMVSTQFEMGPAHTDSNSRYFEVLTLPGPWAGMTIVRKRGNHHLAWKT